MNKVAILGNGPSRVLYKGGYDFAIGCNIPFTDVKFTVIYDLDVAKLWQTDRDVIKCPAYFSNYAWNNIDTEFKDYLIYNNFYLGNIIYRLGDKFTSGHVAAQIAIDAGYDELDLYGFDSYFEDNVDSYTRNFLTTTLSGPAIVKYWREEWQRLIDSNTNVKFNFIRN